ncbi:NTP transferase domain-containing protein [uncultured Erythrobacter sp.]|uniref:phosphocholine cytidylyltransferase family protein n=1 Tax=uncultured Erythrobacter sp. TaxID=263913 RepID=UPI002629D6BE|nr:NTP transferase domain-containing protein [uncultured Erythrobacter sp.]
MDGLILAAGFGSRLRDLFPSKPLATINGVSLLEIALRQLASAGVARAVVVTGYNAEAVEVAVGGMRSRLDLDVITVRVEDWEKPNGFSVMAGASYLPGNYLLVMCDHLLSSCILRGLAGADDGGRDVTLGIDRRIISPLIDPDDATWVERGANGFINRIGKDLTQYDAVDCGAFLATPALAGAIGKAIGQGKQGSLSDGMQLLADCGRAATLDIGDAWWMDVDDPAAHAQAQGLLDEGFSLLGNDAADWVRCRELNVQP